MKASLGSLGTVMLENFSPFSSSETKLMSTDSKVYLTGRQKKKIIIAGAGISGLCCAYESVMPANHDFTDKESEDIADFILTQGKKQSSWVLPGLEGAFRIIEKPSHSAKGVYLLTASYVSKSRIKGWDSVIIKIE